MGIGYCTGMEDIMIDDGTRKYFRDWCDTRGVHSIAVRGAMWDCYRNDPDYWGTAGWTRVFDVVASYQYDEFGRASAMLRED